MEQNLKYWCSLGDPSSVLPDIDNASRWQAEKYFSKLIGKVGVIVNILVYLSSGAHKFCQLVPSQSYIRWRAKFFFSSPPIMHFYTVLKADND